MTTADDYINQVLDVLPRTTPSRSQIAAELRGHIAERIARGQALGDVLSQLGDPVRLANSYLSAEPLVRVSFGRRAAAKLIDMLCVFVVLALIVWLSVSFAPDELLFPLIVLALAIGGSVSFGLYTAIAECLAGQTLGKRLLGIRVVRESGARISAGQAIVRQLPMFLQVYWVDVFFALFTEKHQRAFEMLSETRVVRA